MAHGRIEDAGRGPKGSPHERLAGQSGYELTRPTWGLANKGNKKEGIGKIQFHWSDVAIGRFFRYFIPRGWPVSLCAYVASNEHTRGLYVCDGWSCHVWGRRDLAPITWRLSKLQWRLSQYLFFPLRPNPYVFTFGRQTADQFWQPTKHSLHHSIRTVLIISSAHPIRSSIFRRRKINEYLTGKHFNVTKNHDVIVSKAYVRNLSSSHIALL